MDIIDKSDLHATYHNSYSGFLSPTECDLIRNAIEKDADKLPRGKNTGYTGLTSTYTVYNWLSHPSVEPLDIPNRLREYKEFRDWEYLIIQCWCNQLHQGEGLRRHVHGNRFDPIVKTSNFFLNCNVFLGGEYNITWYEDMGEVENTQGDIHIFSSNLEHEVYTNTGTDIRHSMALDIYPNLTTLNSGIPYGMFNSQRFRIYKRDPAV